MTGFAIFLLVLAAPIAGLAVLYVMAWVTIFCVGLVRAVRGLPLLP